MRINGTIVKYNKYNLKTGESEIVICAGNNGYITIKGIFPRLPKNIPVTVGINNEGAAISEMSLYDDSLLFKTFLTSSYFKSIKTPEQADKIITKTSKPIIEYIKSVSEADFLAAKPSAGVRQLSANIQKSVYKKLRGLYYYIELFNKLISIGGDAEVAKRVYAEKGENALREIDENPYLLSHYGVSFSVCEKQAKEKGIYDCDLRRTTAITEYAMKINSRDGNTCIDFPALCGLIRRIENSTGCKYHTEELFILEAVVRTNYVLEKNGNKLIIHDAGERAAETVIATELKRLCSSPIRKEPLSDKEIEEIEATENIRYSAKQKETFNTITTTGLKIITGGPGTGKTTILRGLIHGFQMRSQGRIVLCSPTGRAAYRMQELTGHKASTIHRLLKLDPTDRGSLYSKQIIGVGLCVVDEASMLDTKLFARLLSAMPSDATVILIGDSDQLPSVEPGNVFSDLIESKKFETYRLEQIYRQKGGSPITENARRVIRGDNNLFIGKQFIVKDLPTESDLKRTLIQIMKKYCLSGRDLSEITVFTPCRNPKYGCSTENLNLAIKKGALGVKENGIAYGPYSFDVNDRIIFNKNNYKKGYFNGMEGIITDIQSHANEIRMAVKTEVGKVCLEEEELEDIELSYALTAHKAQGGECKYAIIIAPMEPSVMLLRKLLYVELTRAKKQVLILNEGNALDIMIKNGAEKKRMTGLVELIEKSL